METQAVAFISRRTMLGQLGAGGALLMFPRSLAVGQAAAQPLEPLGKLAAAKGIAFGVAVDVHRLQSMPKYDETLARECTIFTPENTMKWAAIHPQAEVYNFGPADEIVAFAEKHNIRVHGHTFVWHRALPDWVQQVVTDKATARKVLIEHVTTVVKHYKGRVISWDVVNEAIQPKDMLPDNMRNSFWYQRLGQEYFDIAFGAAHDADPHATLAYNDYGLEYQNDSDQTRRDSVLALVNRLLKRGVPIGAVGLQSHLRAGGPGHFGAGVKDFLHKLRGMGLQCWVTELDVNDAKVMPAENATRDAQVAEVYRYYLETVLGTGCINTVIAWGAWDKVQAVGAEAGINTDQPKAVRPLLFDFEGNPKENTRAVAEVFRNAPQYKP